MKKEDIMPYSLDNIKWKVGDTVYRVNYSTLKLERLTIEKIEVEMVKKEIVVKITTIDEFTMRNLFYIDEFNKWFSYTANDAVDMAIANFTTILCTLKNSI